MDEGLGIFLALVGAAISLAWLLLGFRAVATLERSASSFGRMADALEKFERATRSGDSGSRP
ncbi:MAG: hypothetical protein L0323_07250 [Planctomycetes bacterium]|nr:hypothetical protein [Planctomycetota bacterium]